jgi:hypothetical protein
MFMLQTYSSSQLPRHRPDVLVLNQGSVIPAENVAWYISLAATMMGGALRTCGVSLSVSFGGESLGTTTIHDLLLLTTETVQLSHHELQGYLPPPCCAYSAMLFGAQVRDNLRPLVGILVLQQRIRLRHSDLDGSGRLS